MDKQIRRINVDSPTRLKVIEAIKAQKNIKTKGFDKVTAKML